MANGQKLTIIEIYKLIIDLLFLIINSVYELKIPIDWNITIVYPISKREDSEIVENDREISLLDTSYKRLSLKPTATNHTGIYHFKNDRKILLIIYNWKVYMFFVDFKQTYDRINDFIIFWY